MFGVGGGVGWAGVWEEGWVGLRDAFAGLFARAGALGAAWSSAQAREAPRSYVVARLGFDDAMLAAGARRGI
ncbi:MAG: hypothetical protein LBT54_05230 [Bifidobacteriaceae bacterium]|nr:hypothetical protein [Bifidobacteriaceae bacterium]